MPWLVNVPPQYQGLVTEAAARSGVPANVLALILAHESGWSEHAVGDQGTSFGLAQIHLPAHPNVSRSQAEDPRFAINWTADELKGIWAQTHDAAATIIYHNAPAAAIHYAKTGQWGPTPGLARAAQTYLSGVTAPIGGMKGINRLGGTSAPGEMAMLPVTNEQAYGMQTPQDTSSGQAQPDKPYDLRAALAGALQQMSAGGGTPEGQSASVPESGGGSEPGLTGAPPSG